MNKKEFCTFQEKTFDRIRQLTDSKGEEYTERDGGNQFKNFDEQAAELKLHPFQVWQVFFNKHLSAIKTGIADMLSGKWGQMSESMQSRIDDAILYLILLAAMLKRDDRPAAGGTPARAPSWRYAVVPSWAPQDPGHAKFLAETCDRFAKECAEKASLLKLLLAKNLLRPLDQDCGCGNCPRAEKAEDVAAQILDATGVATAVTGLVLVTAYIPQVARDFCARHDLPQSMVFDQAYTPRLIADDNKITIINLSDPVDDLDDQEREAVFCSQVALNLVAASSKHIGVINLVSEAG